MFCLVPVLFCKCFVLCVSSHRTYSSTCVMEFTAKMWFPYTHLHVTVYYLFLTIPLFLIVCVPTLACLDLLIHLPAEFVLRVQAPVGT